MRKLTLFFAFLLSVMGVTQTWADELTVANGTTKNGYVPFQGQNADYGCKGEYVIPSSDLEDMIGSDITGIKLYAETNNSSGKPNYGPFQIFMKVVDNACPYTSSSSAFQGTEGATIVYEGIISISNNEMSIVFTDNFFYNGGNLLIGFYKDKGGNYLSNYFYGVNQEGYTANSTYSSSGISAISTGTGRTFIPKTTFTYEVASPYKAPASLAASEVETNSAIIEWTVGSSDNSETGWDLEYKKSSDETWTEVHGLNSTMLSYTLSDLESNTSYDVRVRALYGENESKWKTLAFKTAKAAVLAVGFTDDFETNKGWELINGTLTNAWAWGEAINNGGNHSIYISNDGGTTNAYSHSAAIVYVTKLFKFEEGEYTFQYDWKANGESAYDYLRVALVPETVDLTAGTLVPSGFSTTGLPSNWIAIDGGSKLNLSNDWTTKKTDLTIQATRNYFVVFAWRNDGSGGSNPPAAVDNFKILGSAPVLELGGDVVGTTLDFGTVNGETVKTVTITNSGKVAMENITLTETADTDNAFAYAALSKTTLAAGESMDVNVTFSPTETKAYTGTFVVDADDVDAITVNVTATYSNASATIAVTIDNAAVGGTVAFGEVGKQAIKTFTVANDGDQTLNVTIASNNTTDFTVSPSALAVAGHTSETFTVTFLYDAAALDVEKTANITVIPSNDGLSPVTFAVTGTRTDMWSEDFSGNTLPAGWDAGANWTIENGVAKASWTNTSTYLTTPTLTVSATSDVMTFEYKATANNVNVKIQYSKDGGTFTDYSGTPSWISAMTEPATFTITGLSAGDYQFRFANDDYELDNFEGFKLNLADHICVISESTIPSSTSYSPAMKEGQSFNATVTVKENRGIAENLTAKLYAGTEVLGTATGSVAANGTTVLTINCTPTSTTTGSVMMHIEVEYAGGTLTTPNLSRYVAPITYLTLDQTSSDDITAGTYDYVTLKRPFLANWNTVCLPFTISDVEEFFGVGASAYDFSSYDNGTVNFSKVTTLTASFPYIVYVPAAISDDIELTNITIGSSDLEGWYNNHNGVYFRGTYVPIAAGGWKKYNNDDTRVIYILNNVEGKLSKAGANASLKGFRAYFDVPAADAARLSISFNDVATGIGYIMPNGEIEVGSMYNMQGQKVQNAGKGIYIINGKKVVMK